MRKLMMGVAALALPAGSLAALQTTAGASKAPPDPTTCSFSATVLFGTASDKAGATFAQTPLSTAGVQVASSAFYTATRITSALSGCSGAPNADDPSTGSSSFVFTSAAVKGGKTGSPAGSAKGTFWTNVCGPAVSTAGTTLKILKKLKFSTTWTGGQGGTSNYKGGGSALVFAHGTGYALNGTVSGSYVTAKKAATFTAYLLNDADSNAFIDGCVSPNGGDLGSDTGQTGSVSGFHIDPAFSTATL